MSKTKTKKVPVKKRDARLEKLIEILRNDGAITIDRLAALLKVSAKTIQRDIEALKQHERIERVGSDASGYWEVKENGGTGDE